MMTAIDYEMVVAKADCKLCRRQESTTAWAWEICLWVTGRSAPQVWPDKTPQEREIVLQSQFAELLNRPFPGPYYICSVCDDPDIICELCGGLGDCADGDCDEKEGEV